VHLRRAVVQGRVSFPPGAGLWGAFWLWGLEPPAYPYNGEIDVVEYNGTLPERLHTFFHFGRLGADSHLMGREMLRAPLSSAFHDYALRTVPGAVEAFFDGRRHSSWTRADLPPGARWPLDGRFHLILSLSVGGSFVGGPPPDTTGFPATMAVDYVRVRG
jgi:beta-glucanase (GH16 family)